MRWISSLMAADEYTNLAVLRDTMRKFVSERQWERFHSPKNLSISLAIEAAELMEHFQWIDAEESRKLDQQQLDHVGEELADVLCYLLAMANSLNIDLATIFYRKMDMNRRKYPVDDYLGRFQILNDNP